MVVIMESVMKKKYDELLQRLIEKTSESCEGCKHSGYSTRAIAYKCDNPDSPCHKGWMDSPDGCYYHSEIDELEKEFKI